MENGYVFYTKVTGTNQGAFPEEDDRAKGRGALCYQFEFAGSANNEPGRGAASSARHHGPMVILKPWGASSAHFMKAYWNNEVLTEVVMEFVRQGTDGREVLLETITLQNATIASLKRHAGKMPGLAEAELEEIGLRFEKVEIKSGANTVTLDAKNRT